MKKKFLFLNTILFCGSSFLLLNGCATQDLGPDAYKNMTAQEILRDGEQQLEKSNYKDALKRFEAIDALYPFAKEAQQSQLNSIYAYYKADEIESAIASADRYIHLYPMGMNTDYAYYMKGIINYDKGKSWLSKWKPSATDKHDLSNVQKAFTAFNDLVTLFPKSKYTPDAYQHMLQARNYIAQYELNVADFYFKRKAYVASANRAEYVVRHYPQSLQVLPALKIMYQSYTLLGAKDQANKVLQIIKTNYPHEKLD